MATLQEHDQFRPADRNSWNERLRDCHDPGACPGAMSRHEVVETINQTLVPQGATRAIWTAERGGKRSFLPCFITSKNSGAFRWSELSLIPDLYPGRSGPAVDFRDTDTAYEILSAPFSNWRRWDRFSTNVVAGGTYEQLLLEVAKRYGFASIVESEIQCPLIQLPNSWQLLYENFTKKFRYNIRHGEKILRSIGTVTVKRFTRPDDISQFLGSFLSVEKLSWKEAAGTSITRNAVQNNFHSSLAPIAASNGIFRGYILYLDDTAIAHIYGLLCDETFYCLKLSHIEPYKHCSPGIVLTALAIQDLINDSAKYWDFVGPVEGYKMRWTKEVYTTRTHAFFSRSARGRFLALWRRASRFRR